MRLTEAKWAGELLSKCLKKKKIKDNRFHEISIQASNPTIKGEENRERAKKQVCRDLEQWRKPTGHSGSRGY